MKKGYIRLIVFILIIISILSINAFISNFLSGYKMILFIMSLLCFFNFYFVLEQNKKNRFSKDIIFETLLFLGFFFIVYYLLGFVAGLSKNLNYLTLDGLKRFIIPAFIYSIIKEFFRYNMLCKAENSKLCTIFVIILFILFDVSNDYYYFNFNCLFISYFSY